MDIDEKISNASGLVTTSVLNTKLAAQYKKKQIIKQKLVKLK